MISLQQQKKVLEALDEMEAFVLRAKQSAQESGLLANWERDRSTVSSARAVLSRFDQNEMKRFLEVEFRGWSHHFAVYCEDRAVSAIMDRLYRAIKEALQPQRPNSSAEQPDLKIED